MLVLYEEFFKVLSELLLVHRLVINSRVLQPIFFRYCQYECVDRLADLGHGNSVLGHLVGVVVRQDGLRVEDAFVQVDDPISIILQLRDSLLHALPPGLVLLLLLGLDFLGQLYLLPLDAVYPVDLPQQRRINPVVAEVSME